MRDPLSSSMMMSCPLMCWTNSRPARCSPAWSAGRGNFLEAFHHRPFGCGKTTLLDLIEALCVRQLKADSITAAGIYHACPVR